MSPVVIGIAGPHGSGKNTFAEYISNSRPGVCILEFAEPIKRMLAAGLNLSDNDLSDAKNEPLQDINRTPRELMQTLGDWGRNEVHMYTWLYQMRVRLATTQHAQIIVVPDVYTEHEAGFIRKRGIMVHIKGRGKRGPHITQQAIPIDRNLDKVLLNDGNLTAFEAEAVTLIAELLPAPDAPSACQARQYGSSMHCGPCGLNWDTGDNDPPPCPAGSGARIGYLS